MTSFNEGRTTVLARDGRGVKGPGRTPAECANIPTTRLSFKLVQTPGFGFGWSRYSRRFWWQAGFVIVYV